MLAYVEIKIYKHTWGLTILQVYKTGSFCRSGYAIAYNLHI